MTENYSVEVNQPESTNPQLYDREMEEAVIGAVMINPDVYIDLAPLIRPEDFTSTGISGFGKPLPTFSRKIKVLTSLPCAKNWIPRVTWKMLGAWNTSSA
jgi:hypothetical protein